MTNTDDVIRACKNADDISGLVIINRTGELLGHFGLSAPWVVAQLTILLNSSGTQLGETLKVSPFQLSTVNLEHLRFVATQHQDYHYGLVIPASASPPQAVSTLRGITGAPSPGEDAP